MIEKCRKPGRPSGTEKYGEKSPKKLLDLLKTKTWALTCAYYLSDSDSPASSNAIARAANSEIDAGEWAWKYDAACWSRWRRGIRGAKPKTVRDLWEEPQDAYFIGPWVDHKDGIPGGGAFVPLWTALNASAGLRTEWKAISKQAWEGWGPRITVGKGTPSPDLVPDPDFVPSSQDFRSNTSLHIFLTRIVSSLSVSGLLALVAAITLARIDGTNKLLLFDPDPALPYSLHPSVRFDLYRSLEKINIPFQEIAFVAKHFGLKMHDCSTLAYDQYLKLRWRGNDRASMLGQVTEEEWRDIFGTSC